MSQMLNGFLKLWKLPSWRWLSAISWHSFTGSVSFDRGFIVCGPVLSHLDQKSMYNPSQMVYFLNENIWKLKRDSPRWHKIYLKGKKPSEILIFFLQCWRMDIFKEFDQSCSLLKNDISSLKIIDGLEWKLQLPRILEGTWFEPHRIETYWYSLALLTLTVGIRIFHLINILKNFQGIIKGLISGGLCKVSLILKLGGRFAYVFNKYRIH